MLFSEEIKAAIEALLFISNEPVAAGAIAVNLQISIEDTEDLLQEMIKTYEEKHHGIKIIYLAEGYQFVTKKEHAPIIKNFLKPQFASLSSAALETLAIIAYKQPVTRAEIEQIRGVKVDRIIVNLLEKELIIELGRKETVGRPIIYGTSKKFLQWFGLESIKELPPLTVE